MVNTDVAALLEQARALQERKMAVVEALVEAKATLADTERRAAEERAALEARLGAELSAAKKLTIEARLKASRAGWTDKELGKLGFPAPRKRSVRRARRTDDETLSTTGATDSDGTDTSTTEEQSND